MDDVRFEEEAQKDAQLLLVDDQSFTVSSLLVEFLCERGEKIPQKYQARFINNAIALFVLKMCYCTSCDEGITNDDKIEFLNTIVEKISSKEKIRKLFEGFDNQLAEADKKQHGGG